MRRPNEIDAWRGMALATIFINHVPSLFYERFTLRNISLSDSAELFVFLAGWSLYSTVKRPNANAARLATIRLLRRAGEIYAAQILLTMIALAIIAAAALRLDQPLLLEWHNAGPVFLDPVETHVGLILLSHQLGYFNILPLYIVLMAAAPLALWLNRLSSWLLLIVSLALWLMCLVTGLNLPTWPVEGRWFFNPFAWQVIFILGFLLAQESGLGGWARQWRGILKIPAIPLVLGAAILAWYMWSPNPLRVPEPRLFFLFDKNCIRRAGER